MTPRGEKRKKRGEEKGDSHAGGKGHTCLR